MSFSIFRSRKALPIHDSALNPARLGPDETRRAAMAFAIGEHQPSTDPPRGRLGRANLPDVDFSRAIPVRQPSRLQRLARLLGLGRQPAAPKPDEWRVLRPLSDDAAVVRHEDNVISINRAA